MMIILLILFNFYLIQTANTHEIYDQSGKYSSESVGHAKKPLFLTPYINSGEILLAQNLSRVLPLKGSGNLKSYSGFLTVDDVYNSNLFFWFFPSEKNYTDAPIILWLQGGPGQSSMFGLFEENGPFYVTNEQELKLRRYSWSLTNSVLYIDNPVGAGFSFTDNEKGYAKDQDDIRKNLYNALIQFFRLFPDLQKNDFYVCGESYGGKYVPAIGYSIHENNPKSEIKINLKGLCIGNGFSDPINMLGYSKYLYQIGLIDKNHVKYLREFEYKALKHIHNKQWDEAMVMKGSILGHVDLFTGGVNMYNYVSDNYSDLEFRFPYVDFIESDHVREAIHVGNVSFYRVNPFVYNELKYDILKSVKPWVEILLEYYRMFFYSGQLDIIVAYPFTEKFIKHLQWSGANEYNIAKRMVVTDRNGVAGYVKMAGNLNFALIRNAGHMVPADQPAWAYKFLQRFLINAESDDLSLFYNELLMDY